MYLLERENVFLIEDDAKWLLGNKGARQGRWRHGCDVQLGRLLAVQGHSVQEGSSG